jgi:hypothetical protein
MSASYQSFSIKGKHASFPVILSKVIAIAVEDEEEDHSAAAKAVASLSNVVAEAEPEVAAATKVETPVYEVLVPFNKVCKSFGGSINRDQGKEIHNYYTEELDAWLKANSLIDIRSSKRLRIYSFNDFSIMFHDKPEILADMATKILAHLKAQKNITIADEDTTCLENLLIPDSARLSPPRKRLVEDDDEQQSPSPPPAPKKRAYRRRVNVVPVDEEDEEEPKKRASRRQREPEDEDDEDDDEPHKLPRKRAVLKDNDVQARLARIEEHLEQIDPAAMRAAYFKQNEKALKAAFFAANAEELKKEYFSELNKQLATFVESKK